ncbi:hypothetical protein GCM10010915_03710 [Microbacterium faecale]|uniref:DNA/RNA endonuclease G n=1 Tax=Microbacterium faecale TaxID=1804630 RepID=A0A916Y2F9_9MICO|nr:DNA/RNA endonuclease G [Microbacterium faecale]GGD26913.1 hypothetical protein GCM10010915_03710 [Microbacterium faecale]
MTNPVLTRVVRREAHSPRTVMTVVVLVLVVAAAVYAGIEIVLHLLRAAPLLVTPGAALAWLAALPTAESRAAIILGAGVVAVAGVILLWFAVAPGRRPQHALGVSGHAVIVDNGVIASAVAERVRLELDLPKGAVNVGVGHRTADVTVRRATGQVVDRARVRSVVERELDGYASSPRLKARARVRRSAERGGVS